MPVFVPLGDLPGGTFQSQARGVSGDGSTVIGTSGSGYGGGFRWDGSMSELGDLSDGNYSVPYGVSADGSVIVGGADGGLIAGEAFRWSGGVMIGLDALGTFVTGIRGVRASDANAVSGDGTTIVGDSTSSRTRSEAFRWSDGVMVALGDLPGGIFNSSAVGVSFDGSTIAGNGTSALGSEAFVWTSGGGMIGLGDLPGGDFHSVAFAISADGSTIVGYGHGDSGSEAFRWRDGVMVGLGYLPGGSENSAAQAVSADGSTIVGSGANAHGEIEAVVWDATHGMRELDEVLSLLGLGPQLSGWRLLEATGVSADGQTIVGHGINPDGNTEAWMATIPEPTTAILLAMGALGLALQRRRHAAAAR